MFGSEDPTSTGTGASAGPVCGCNPDDRRLGGEQTETGPQDFAMQDFLEGLADPDSPAEIADMRDFLSGIETGGATTADVCHGCQVCVRNSDEGCLHYERTEPGPQDEDRRGPHATTRTQQQLTSHVNWHIKWQLMQHEEVAITRLCAAINAMEGFAAATEHQIRGEIRRQGRSRTNATTGWALHPAPIALPGTRPRLSRKRRNSKWQRDPDETGPVRRDSEGTDSAWREPEGRILIPTLIPTPVWRDPEGTGSTGRDPAGTDPPESDLVSAGPVLPQDPSGGLPGGDKLGDNRLPGGTLSGLTRPDPRPHRKEDDGSLRGEMRATDLACTGATAGRGEACAAVRTESPTGVRFTRTAIYGSTLAQTHDDTTTPADGATRHRSPKNKRKTTEEAVRLQKQKMCEGCGLKVPSHGLESERKRRWCVGCGRAKGALCLRKYCEHCGLKQFPGCPCRPGCGKNSPCAAGLGIGLQSPKFMR